MHVPAHYLASAAICQPRNRRVYLPLLFSFGVVDVALDEVLGVVDEDELVLPDDGVEDDEAFDDVSLDAGGVPEALDELDGVLDDDDDVLLSLVLGVVDDIEPLVAGGVVVVVDEDEVDGEGVTTGGVVLVVDDVSRLHPATPTTTPLTSNAINAVFIAISSRLMRVAPARFSSFDAMGSMRRLEKILRRINAVANRQRRV
jgi:hypothetical protein